MPIRREILKEIAQVQVRHFCRMAFVMEEYVSLDPMEHMLSRFGRCNAACESFALIG